MKNYCILIVTLFSTVAAFNVGHRSSAIILPSVHNSPAVSYIVKRAVSIPIDDNININQPAAKTVEKQNTLNPKDAWIANLDYEAFGKDVAELGKQLLSETGDADVKHLQKIVKWRNVAAILGLATCWTTPNPLTIIALSTWTYASWTMIAHHTCHGGYNRVDAGRYNSRRFGLGLINRCIDWLDWMQPEAWNLEHNRLHHYSLNEEEDPDLVQRNIEFVREANVPMMFKYAVVLAFLPVWKWYYYAPNTFKELKTNEWVKAGKKLPDGFDPKEAITVATLMDPRKKSVRQIINPLDFLVNCVGPQLGRCIVIPSALALIPNVGLTLAVHALVNLILAELLTNVHSFVTIVTNHCGDDMYTFDDAVKPKTGAFYCRQVIGSANYAAGSDMIDFSHGFLNYQIEHHVYPDLSMLQYQKGAPRLKAICDEHGVPYIQESVFERLRKTINIMVGKTTMRTFPTEYEPEKDKTNRVTWKSSNGAIDE